MEGGPGHGGHCGFRNVSLGFGVVRNETAQLRERVREILRVHPTSQRQFAASIGLDATKLSKSLTGTRRFTPGELTSIAEVGNVTVNWLLNGSDEAETVAAAPALSARQQVDVDDLAESGRYRQILEAAWRLIAVRGYHSVRIADVATACGMSAATIHYYFPGREDLLTESLRFSVKQAFDRQVAELHAIEDAVERLLRLIELQLPTPGHLQEEWSIWLQVWNESSLRPGMRPLHSEAYTRWHETVARTVRDGQEQDAFAGVDPEDFTVRLTALIDGLGIQVMTGRSGRSVERMRSVLRDFVRSELEVDAE